MNPTNIILLIIISVFYSSTGLAQELELTWVDLIPESAVFDDPFATMDREQLEYLGFVARVRAMIESGREVSSTTMDEVLQIENELVESGIDVDALLAQRQKMTELRKKTAKMVARELNGAKVKMPGYLLPIEFRESKVTEFLLVPWVGACIHTPPPPPNQIVHVILAEGNGYESRSIYEPVWVAGELFTRSATKNLFLVDGEGNIDIGYRMQAREVEKYKK